MRAIDIEHTPMRDAFGEINAYFFELARLQSTNQRSLALQGVAFDEAADVVWQGVVDGGFNALVKTQHTAWTV